MWGLSVEDLLDIYILYNRIVTKYCSVSFHSSLTKVQSKKLEIIQNTVLKVILGDMYISYRAALEMFGLDTLYARRQKRCLDFAPKCIKRPRNRRLYPLNPPVSNEHYIRDKDKFKVNYARTESCKISAIPFQ